MNPTVRKALVICAVVAFMFVALGFNPLTRVDLLALGLAFWAGSQV